ncbi:phage tail protein [Salibacterium lacus]|uniref:DUF6781 family protein n=1 Tax=Salibacterium lacus TaxID=1898109 RepID=A0ABW5SY73_9BACI
MNERLQAAVGARIGEFKRKMKEVNAITKQTAMGASKKVDADTSSFQKKMAAAYATAKAFPKTITVEVEARVNRFHGAMSRLANVIRSFNEVTANMISGGLLTFFPALVPVIASATGALGAMGVSLGVVSGGLAGLGSSAGMAGAGFAGLLTVLTPAVARITEAHKAIMEGNRVLSSYAGPMQSVLQQVFNLKNQFSQLQESVRPDLFAGLTTGLEVAQLALTRLTPGIQNIVQVFRDLMSTFQNTVKNASDVRAAFRWFNDRAPEAFRNWAKIAGNAVRGVVNLLRAFDPVAKSMEKGLGSMTQRFAEWTASLGESQKFQRFIDYVQTNGPKLVSIVGNVTQGLVGMFSAFAPMTGDMLSGLQKMTKRFKEWGQSLSGNKQFQQFADYIRTNGPKVIDLIGNIGNFLVEMGKAMAPLGSQLLDMANGFLKWLNSMMESNPMIGKIVAGAISLTGAIKALTPIIVAVRALFGGAFGKMLTKFIPFRTQLVAGLKVVGKQIGAFMKRIPIMAATLIKNFAKMAARATVWAARMAAQWVIAMGPIGWITTAVIALVALIIANWDKVKKWTKKAWTAVSTAVSNAVNKVVSWVKDRFPGVYQNIKKYLNMAEKIIKEVWRYIKETFQNAIDFVKALVKGDFEGMKDAIKSQMENARKAISTIWSAIKKFFGDMLSQLWDNVKETFTSIKDSIQEKLKAARDVVQSVWQSIKSRIEMRLIRIWNQVKMKFNQIKTSIQDNLEQAKSTVQSVWQTIKAYVRGNVTKIWNIIKDRFRRVVNAVRTKMSEVRQWIEDKWNEAKSFLQGISLIDIGKNIIDGLVQGINNALGSVKSAVSGLADKIPGWLKSKLGIASPSRVIAKQVGRWIPLGLRKGMQSEEKAVEKAADEMGEKAIPDMSGGLASNERSVREFGDELVKINQRTQDEIQQVKKEARQDDSTGQQDVQKEIEGILDQRLSDVKSFISNKQSLEQLSVKDEVAIWKQATDAFEDGTDRKREAHLALRDAKRKVDKQMLQSEMNYLDRKKKAGEISLADEVQMLNQLSTKYAEHSDKYQQIQDRKTNTLQTINDRLTSINDEYLKKTKEVNQELKDEQKKLTQEYKKAVQDRADALYSTTGLFDEMTSNFEGSGSDLMKNLRGQVQGFKQWSKDLEQLSQRGLDESLIAELQEMGPSAQKEIAALNKMSDKQLTKYQNLWQEKSRLARVQAEKELEGMRKDTQQKINQLRTRSKEQLEQLRKEWVKKVQDVTNGTSEELSSLKQIGADSIQGLMNGMDSMEGRLMRKARSMAQAVSREISSALEVRSPSRVTMKIGEYTGQGLAKGMDKSLAGIKRTSQDMATAAMPQMQMPSVGSVQPSTSIGEFSASDERKQHVTVMLDSEVIGRGVAPAVGDEIAVRTGVR